MFSLTSLLFRSALLICALSLVACGPEDEPELPDAGTPDVGMDAGVDMSSPGDVGPNPDIGPVDSGIPDTGGPMDAGNNMTDMAPAEQCANDMDDDGDAKIDCADEDCAADEACRVSAVAAGYQHACAVFEDGHVSCWGDDQEGELGDDGTNTEPQSPVDAEGITNATDVAAGRDFTCALLDDGTVQCWGLNEVGQLGDSSFIDSTVPVEVSGIDDAIDIAAGEEQACAISGADGQVLCWGASDFGQAGADSPQNEPVEIELFAILDIVPLDDATGVECNARSCCARRAGGKAACWGWNRDGQLGGASTAESSDVALVVADEKNPLSPLEDVVDVATGAIFSCFTLVDESVWCAGATPALQASVGEIPDIAVELELFADSDQIWAGTGHACALRSNGRVFCWGENGDRQTGKSEGGFNDGYQLVGVENPIDFDAGHRFNCFVDENADVYCFGQNDRGQLGVAATMDGIADPQLVAF